MWYKWYISGILLANWGIINISPIPPKTGNQKQPLMSELYFQTKIRGQLSLRILADRTSDNEQGVYNHLRNERYLGSMKPFSVSVIGFLGFVIFPKDPFVCPKEGIGPRILSHSFRMGLEPEKSCSIREGSGFLDFLGFVTNSLNKLAKRKTILKKKQQQFPCPREKQKKQLGDTNSA